MTWNCEFLRGNQECTNLTNWSELSFPTCFAILSLDRVLDSALLGVVCVLEVGISSCVGLISWVEPQNGGALGMSSSSSSDTLPFWGFSKKKSGS